MNRNQKQWIALYTRHKWEKKVHQLLLHQGIKSYCPLVKTKKQWADRKKIVELPLFSSYVFAQVDPLEQYRVQQTAGVVSIVYHCGKPAYITANEIERIKGLLTVDDRDLEVISFDQIGIGDKIKVREGILSDWQGEVITVKGKSVVMVLEQFNCALLAKVDVSQQNLLLA